VYDKRYTQTLKVSLQKFLLGDYRNFVIFWGKDFRMVIAM
jgi:hypothetical protein